MKRIISLALLALFSMNFLVACNTVKGAGKDVEKVGEKVQLTYVRGGRSVKVTATLQSD